MMLLVSTLMLRRLKGFLPVSKKNEWKTILRKFDRNSTTVLPSSGAESYTYAHAQVRVTQRRKNGNGYEMREKVEYTDPLYMHQSPELQLAFKVAIEALAELESKIREIEYEKMKKELKLKKIEFQI